MRMADCALTCTRKEAYQEKQCDWGICGWGTHENVVILCAVQSCSMMMMMMMMMAVYDVDIV